MLSINLNVISDVLEAIGSGMLWLLTQLWNAIVWLFKDVIYSFLSWFANGFVWLFENYPISTILVLICIILVVCRLWGSFMKK